MRRHFAVCAFVFTVVVFALTNCNNYDLLNQLENPGSASGMGSRNLRIFLTASGYSGNLGGTAGADAICVADGANPNGAGNGSWKALIGAPDRLACTTANCTGGIAENLNWVLKPNTKYMRPDGFEIGNTNEKALLIFPLVSPISPMPTTFAWTGLGADWVYSTSCGDWISGGGSGNRAQVDSLTSAAIFTGAQTCGVSERLYCVEQ
ncbi:MAG: DUF1554 domain-containing protein [Spirochaetota bacterium]